MQIEVPNKKQADAINCIGLFYLRARQLVEVFELVTKATTSRRAQKQSQTATSYF
ncbi:MAG TPA: hypothetical protein VNN73_05190 [Blastocatellia bacterium]|nr:hypothetical protein [Blastocatellia bacterium]